MNRNKLRIAWILGLVFLASNGYSNESTDVSEAMALLKQGKAIAIMRHALAPGTGDPAEFNLENCDTQRNLSDQGRAQARFIGDYLRKNGISEARVFTSEWCRCEETARLLNVGEPTPLPALNSFFQNWSVADQQTSQILSVLPDWFDDTEAPSLLVTHQVNIRALTGQSTTSGEILIIQLEGKENEVVVLASIPANDGY